MEAIELKFEKIYRYPRVAEPCFIGIPVKEGLLTDVSRVTVKDGDRKLPVQAKVTSRHKDGSVRFAFVRFLADLPGNAGKTLYCNLNDSAVYDISSMDKAVVVQENDNGYVVDNGEVRFELDNHSSSIFAWLEACGKRYESRQFVGPVLKDGSDNTYSIDTGDWYISEKGAVCTVFRTMGCNYCGDKKVEFELILTIYAGKPWFELGYRIINTTDGELKIKSLTFNILRDKNSSAIYDIVPMEQDEELDSTGCGDKPTDNSCNDGPVFHTRGIGELDAIEEKARPEGIRTCVGHSNYKTDFYIGRDGSTVNSVIDEKFILKEANEHFAEVFYGTFFADCTDSQGGVCATVFQAQQNYPKAVVANDNGIAVMLVPEDAGNVVMQMGMSRQQKLLLHFHDAGEKLLELDNRSLIYQMPDRPIISPEYHKSTGVYMDVFPDIMNEDFEINLIGKADGHSRCYGMLNFGDTPDPGYTMQGRGNGQQVWLNNEYDYPHACALMFVRTGVRRFLDYNIVSANHWMDVDVCHYHTNPLYIGGQWEHTNGHCKNGTMVCSHEWVEGLLDYYHLTGDERGLETAVGIGDNVLRILDTPMYAHVGEANARETGWALRTLVAMYVETWDEKWLSKCHWILDNFKAWEQQYGNWLAPYTDNTVVRVGFMISVAVGSVMRYYRVFPEKDLKDMMLRAIDDLIENCLLDNGLFYYKELPSLKRNGNNTLLLEALAIAYELTGNAEYLKYGVRTFKMVTSTAAPGAVGSKKVEGDAVIVGNQGTKNFAQSFIPLTTYYKAASNNGLI